MGRSRLVFITFLSVLILSGFPFDVAANLYTHTHIYTQMILMIQVGGAGQSWQTDVLTYHTPPTLPYGTAAFGHRQQKRSFSQPRERIAAHVSASDEAFYSRSALLPASSTPLSLIISNASDLLPLSARPLVIRQKSSRGRYKVLNRGGRGTVKVLHIWLTNTPENNGLHVSVCVFVRMYMYVCVCVCAQLPWGGYANVAEGSPTADAAGESGFTTAFCEVCDNGLTGLDHGIELKYSNIPFLAASPVQLMSLGPKHRRQWHIKEVEERPQEDVFFFFIAEGVKKRLWDNKSQSAGTRFRTYVHEVSSSIGVQTSKTMHVQ